MFHRTLLFIGVNLLANASFALPKEQLTAGGIAIIPLPSYISENAQVKFGSNLVPVITREDALFAVVGIPLSHKEPELSITITDNQLSDHLTVQLSNKDYPEQRITLQETQSNKVTPSEDELARYSREATEQKTVYQLFSSSQTKSWPNFAWPIKGRISSPFGLKRFFNDQPRDPHSGLDVAAPEGKAIAAPANGIIAQTGDYFFNGKTVMIDHGQGIISMLCHLSKVDVAKGQTIKQGDIIGLVGQTGRATGPHLHYGVSINNARIDPLLVLPTP